MVIFFYIIYTFLFGYNTVWVINTVYTLDPKNSVRRGCGVLWNLKKKKKEKLKKKQKNEKFQEILTGLSSADCHLQLCGGVLVQILESLKVICCFRFS